MSVVELPAGTRLAYALLRKSSRRALIGGTAFLALFLGAIGLFILRSARASRRAGVLPSGYDARDRQISWVVETRSRVRARADSKHVFPVPVE